MGNFIFCAVSVKQLKLKVIPRLSGYMKYLTSLLRKHSAIIHVITIMLVLSLTYKIGKDIQNVQLRNYYPIQNKLKLMKVVYSRHGLISLKNPFSKVEKQLQLSI